MTISSDGKCRVLSLRQWLPYTPQGFEKGSRLNRPAKGVIVKSVETAWSSENTLYTLYNKLPEIL